MADVTPIEIPNRALFKASEVCELLKVQPYVLKTWEAEFPELGVVKANSTTRVYRRGDVERVLHIKHLLLVEGLTLAGARRRIEEQEAPVVGEAMEPVMEELLGRNARERLTEIKRGLRSLLELLSGQGAAGNGDFRLAPPEAKPVAAPVAASRKPPSRPAPSPKRKRSA